MSETERRLILSVFPGIDALGLAFGLELPEACVVRGPDPIFGSLHDVRTFHPPAGAFWGVVGGPPCQAFSVLRHLNPACGQKHGNLIPEFERVVAEAQPAWWLMENVPDAPEPVVPGYRVHALLLNNRWTGAEQNRLRRFSFGTRDGRRLHVEVAALEAPLHALAVTSHQQQVPVKLVRDGKGGHRPKARLLRPPTVTGTGIPPSKRGQSQMTLARICELQGLPPDFADELPFTTHGKRRAIGNCVPVPMGRAIARAVRRAMAAEPQEQQGQQPQDAGREERATA